MIKTMDVPTRYEIIDHYFNEIMTQLKSSPHPGVKRAVEMQEMEFRVLINRHLKISPEAATAFANGISAYAQHYQGELAHPMPILELTNVVSRMLNDGIDPSSSMWAKQARFAGSQGIFPMVRRDSESGELVVHEELRIHREGDEVLKDQAGNFVSPLEKYETPEQTSFLDAVEGYQDQVTLGNTEMAERMWNNISKVADMHPHLKALLPGEANHSGEPEARPPGKPAPPARPSLTGETAQGLPE